MHKDITLKQFSNKNTVKIKKPLNQRFKGLMLWSHKDLNLGPPDYESGALTN